MDFEAQQKVLELQFLAEIEKITSGYEVKEYKKTKAMSKQFARQHLPAFRQACSFKHWLV